MRLTFGTFSGVFAKTLMVFSVTALAISASAAAKTSKAPSKILSIPKAHAENISPLTDTRSRNFAVTFVKRTGINKNLSLLVLEDVKNRRQIRDAISLYGMDKVQSTVVEAIKSAQKTYAPKWNQLMAKIYNEHFSEAELASILAKREASPYFPRLLKLQDTIANAVHARGDQMVASARVDVMTEVAGILPIVSPAAIGR